MYWSSAFNHDTDTRWYGASGCVEIDPGVPQTVDYSFRDVTSVCAYDVNSDGLMDVLGAASQDNEVAWWQNTDGTGQSWLKHSIDDNYTHASFTSFGDLNGDGIIDVLGTASLINDVTWWENTDGTGTAWLKHTIDGDFDDANCIFAGDFNGDGYLDVLVSAGVPGAITWWRNLDGSGASWVENPVDSTYDYSRNVFPEDIDGDGDLDIIAAYFYLDLVLWWENTDGLGTSWTEHLIQEDFCWASWVFSEDVDGDGDKDVLGAAKLDSEIVWWENADGTGVSWIEHVIDGDFAGAQSVCCKDLDSDGDLDVIGAGIPSDDISWWENTDGQGTAWVEHTVYGSFLGACCVFSEDINNDGFNDILAGAEYDDDITWWDLTRYPPEGSLESSILDTQCQPQWASVSWSGTQPSGTDLYFQYKSSDDLDEMGPWSSPIYEPSILSGQLQRYFLYRLVLQTSETDTTPTLHDFTLVWDPVGVSEESQSIFQGVDFLPIIPNPVTGPLQIRCILSECSTLEISIYDLSGRSVRRVERMFEAGEQSFQVDNLDPGVYFVRISSDRFAETAHFSVIQ